MFISEFREALAIDKTYTLEKLKKLFVYDVKKSKSDSVVYQDTQALYNHLLSDFLNIPRSIDSIIDEPENPGDFSYVISNDNLNKKESVSPAKNPCTFYEDSTKSEHFVVLKSFIALYPTTNTSSFYRTAFFLTFSNWLIDQNQKDLEAINYHASFVDESQLLKLFDAAYDLALASVDNRTERIVKLIAQVRECIHQITKSEKFTEQEYEYLRLCAQFIVFVLAVELEKPVEKVYSSKEYISYIALFIAETYLLTDESSASLGLMFAKNSLCISNPSARQYAFQTLGNLALSSGNLQLGYDTFFSWIKRIKVDTLQEFPMVASPFSQEELEWRNTPSGIRSSSEMTAYYAVACWLVSDTYEINSPRRKAFHEMAEFEIKKVLDNNPQTITSDNYFIYRVYGRLLLSQGSKEYKKTEQAYQAYQKYQKGVLEFHNVAKYNAVAINSSISAITLVLLQSYMSSKIAFDDWKKTEIASTYWDLLYQERKKYELFCAKTNDEKSIDNLDMPIIKQKTTFEKLLDFGANIKNPDVLCISNILILIRRIAQEIQNQLRRVEYSTIDYFTRDGRRDKGITGKRSGDRTIAYYTTLKTATYLFEQLSQSNPQKAPEPSKDKPYSQFKNCLTVMHAKYMNDPHEGLTLLDTLISKGKNILVFPNGSAKQFRESVYDDSFIFLKSFTTKMDKLFMWNRYASDYDSDGNNSNGCCIQFDPEMINRIVGRTYSVASSLANEDDYHLYRMVYISDGGEINKELNHGISNDAINLYKALRQLTNELNDKLLKLKEDDEATYDRIIDDVYSSEQISLQSIMFLFKSDDYCEEDESRLIFIRDYEQQESIRLLDGKPGKLSKLAINPYNQIYIKKIIFGPNVRNSEEWKPYLQYHLNQIWTKYEMETEDYSIPPHKRYSIESSKIHYHT